jgi:hypothetical protein
MTIATRAPGAMKPSRRERRRDDSTGRAAFLRARRSAPLERDNHSEYDAVDSSRRKDRASEHPFHRGAFGAPNVRVERLCPPRSSWYQTGRRAGEVRSNDKLGGEPGTGVVAHVAEDKACQVLNRCL